MEAKKEAKKAAAVAAAAADSSGGWDTFFVLFFSCEAAPVWLPLFPSGLSRSALDWTVLPCEYFSSEPHATRVTEPSVPAAAPVPLPPGLALAGSGCGVVHTWRAAYTSTCPLSHAFLLWKCHLRACAGILRGFILPSLGTSTPACVA